MIYPPLDHPFWLLVAFAIGACIGSFLNVVIYRMPLDLSVNDPKRSFCPKCKSEIPMSRNIPLVSWLALRGKCADCKAPISPRYFFVELLTGILFAVTFWVVAGRVDPKVFSVELLALFLLWFMVACLVALSFIDAEHFIIPLELTISSTVAGVLAAVAMPSLPDLVGWSFGEPNWLDGLKFSVIGWVFGFFGLWAVVLFGKMAFGRMVWNHDEPVEWRLEEPENEEEPILFHMGEESLAWWDIFYRRSDRLVIETETLVVDGKARESGTLIITDGGLTLPDKTDVPLEELESLSGTARKAVIPREAMGMGDVHLMGVVGAFFGWFGVFFSLLCASIYAIVAAILGRIGFGSRLPFGPFIALGALTWLFGGWKLAVLYLSYVR